MQVSGMEQKDTRISASQLFAEMEPLLQEGRRAAFTVSGMSMWPFLCHGRDSVVLARADPSQLRPGDIVLFQVPVLQKYILHRITHMDKANGTFQTAGDGNCFYDGWFPMTAIRGVVTQLHSRGRTIPVTALSYRAAVAAWRMLFPIRPALLKLLLRISKRKRHRKRA